MDSNKMASESFGYVTLNIKVILSPKDNLNKYAAEIPYWITQALPKDMAQAITETGAGTIGAQFQAKPIAYILRSPETVTNYLKEKAATLGKIEAYIGEGILELTITDIDTGVRLF